MNVMLLRCLGIGFAGFIGALLRWGVGLLFGQLNIRFPLGTLFINLTGSMFLGWFMTYITKHPISDTTRLAIGVGFVGAYTTFSTWMYESANLVQQDGAILMSVLNLLGSLVLGVLAVYAGIMLGRWT